MTKQDVINLVRTHIRTTEFPKICSQCGTTYESFKEFLQETTHIGEPVSYDAELNEHQPEHPLGVIAMSHCSCGNAISVSTYAMAKENRLKSIAWIQEESQKQNISRADFLKSMRDEIDRLELSS